MRIAGGKAALLERSRCFGVLRCIPPFGPIDPPQMPELYQERFQAVPLRFLGFGRLGFLRVQFETVLDSEQAAEIDLARSVAIERRPLFPFGKLPDGRVRDPILVGRPGAQPSGRIQVNVSATRAEAFTFVEQQIGHFQPCHGSA